jgi:histidinol phosphatase-like PHP family hydrolase
LAARDYTALVYVVSTETGNKMIYHTFNAISPGNYYINLIRKLRVLNDNEINLIVNTRERKEVQLKWQKLSNI